MTSYLQKYVHNYVYLLIFSILQIVLTLPAMATGLAPSVGQDAIQLALRIENEQLFLEQGWSDKQIARKDLSPERRLQLMRNMLSDDIINGGATLKQDVQSYEKLAKQNGHEKDIRVGQLFSALIPDDDAESGAENYTNIEKKMYGFLNDPDWFVRHRAYYITSLVHSYSSNGALAIKFAQDGLSIIPDEQSKYSQEAKILSTTNIAYLHNLSGNPDLSIEAIKNTIALKKDAGEPVNGISNIYNLIYAFNTWRDHDTTKALIEILLRIEDQAGADYPGVAEFRASGVYNQLGDFENGLHYAEETLAKTDRRLILELVELNRIISLAGLNRVTDAKAALTEFYKNVPEERRASGVPKRKILHIQALLALAEGDNTSAQRFFNQRQDISVQNVLEQNNSQTAKMLASLQNTKDRQDEREAALKRESELKQLALDRQKRVIVLLFAVAVILALLTFGTAAFARYRAKAAKKMELAAQKARAGEKAKSEFLAVMSHELRTPLNGILGMADILSRSAPTEALREKNNIILQSGNELLALVENIFDMTLLENDGVELDIDKADVHAMIEKVCNARRNSIQSRSVQFTTYIDPAVPQFMAIDGTRAAQCLDHLLSNASKFTLEGRVHVHITAKQASDGAPTELTLIVADTGVGISEEALARLFQPFVQADSSMTRQYGGAGLGLAITRSLARLMDGDLTVNSRENKGSEFTLTLSGMAIAPEISVPQDSRRALQPMPEPPISAVASPIMQDSFEKPNPLTDMVSVQGQRFLVVEDDIACQDVVKSLLEPTLSQVTCVGNGHEALQALSVNTYDFVIMDIRMPGMDGVTAARRIRKSGKAHANVPIIALTADVAAETNAKCMVAGVDMFLTKPVRAEEFYRAIELVSRKTKVIQQKQQRIA